MTSKVELCNIALLKLGKSTITALSDNTEEGRRCSLLFDEMRNEVLMEGAWSFAIKRAELGLLSETPEYGFDYKHQLPTDCLRVIEINEDVPGTYDYRIEGREILSDLNSIKIRYLSDEEDTATWDPAFKRAFILRMAAEMSYGFRADKQLTQGLFQQYQQAVEMGLSQDGKQGSSETIVSPDLLEIR